MQGISNNSNQLYLENHLQRLELMILLSKCHFMQGKHSAALIEQRRANQLAQIIFRLGFKQINQNPTTNDQNNLNNVNRDRNRSSNYQQQDQKKQFSLKTLKEFLQPKNQQKGKQNVTAFDDEYDIKINGLDKISFKNAISKMTYELSKLNPLKILSLIKSSFLWSIKLKYKFGIYTDFSENDYRSIFEILYQTGHVSGIISLFMEYVARTLQSINLTNEISHREKLNQIPYFQASNSILFKDEMSISLRKEIEKHLGVWFDSLIPPQHQTNRAHQESGTDKLVKILPKYKKIFEINSKCLVLYGLIVFQRISSVLKLVNVKSNIEILEKMRQVNIKKGFDLDESMMLDFDQFNSNFHRQQEQQLSSTIDREEIKNCCQSAQLSFSEILLEYHLIPSGMEQNTAIIQYLSYHSKVYTSYLKEFILENKLQNRIRSSSNLFDYLEVMNNVRDITIPFHKSLYGGLKDLINSYAKQISIEQSQSDEKQTDKCLDIIQKFILKQFPKTFSFEYRDLTDKLIDLKSKLNISNDNRSQNQDDGLELLANKIFPIFDLESETHKFEQFLTIKFVKRPQMNANQLNNQQSQDIDQKEVDYQKIRKSQSCIGMEDTKNDNLNIQNNPAFQSKIICIHKYLQSVNNLHSQSNCKILKSESDIVITQQLIEQFQVTLVKKTIQEKFRDHKLIVLSVNSHPQKVSSFCKQESQLNENIQKSKTSRKPYEIHQLQLCCYDNKSNKSHMFTIDYEKANLQKDIFDKIAQILAQDTHNMDVKFTIKPMKELQSPKKTSKSPLDLIINELKQDILYIISFNYLLVLRQRIIIKN
eukprot:403359873